MIYCFIISMVLCLLLPSCSKKPIIKSNHFNNAHQPSSTDNNHQLLNNIIQQEAMLVDIPIPLYDSRILPHVCEDSDNDTTVFGYKSPLSLGEAVEFFLSQMERYGWRHVVSFETCCKSIVQFKSPARYCTVIVKKIHNESVCSIFIYIKRTSTDARS